MNLRRKDIKMTLSQKKIRHYDDRDGKWHDLYEGKNVKQFIKDLKEELKYDCDDRECEICKNQDEVIDKLAGDELK